MLEQYKIFFEFLLIFSSKTSSKCSNSFLLSFITLNEPPHSLSFVSFSINRTNLRQIFKMMNLIFGIFPSCFMHPLFSSVNLSFLTLPQDPCHLNTVVQHHCVNTATIFHTNTTINNNN